MENNTDQNNISRRKFLSSAVTAIGSLVAAAVAAPLIGYFLSPAWQKKAATTIPVARADRIPVGTPTFVRFEQRVSDAWLITTASEGVWVVTKDGKNFTVFDPHCTHLRCPYYWNEQKKEFDCPCHSGVFDIDGNVVSGPPPRPLDKLEFTIVNGEIEVTGKKAS